jgi:signal transduction histidine kinase
VGEGDLDVRAPPAPGEVGEAVAAFNHMAKRLREFDDETQRLRANEQLSELGEVGRGLAHSLRNPLNALGLALDQLAERAAAGSAEDPADPAPVEVAAAARRQIRRIDAALRGFLALSAGGAAPVEVDLVAVSRDVALEALQSRPTGDPSPRVEVTAAAEPLPLPGVEAELRAALQALVVNALEASPAGAPIVVTVSAAPAERDDEGPGVPPAVRERLFTPHVTTKAAGAGIGLYLAHRIATTRYGGALELTDRPHGGTRASLLLRPRGSVGPGAAHGR